MTGRGPCPAMRLSIYERKYVSPPFDEKLINNGSAAHAWGGNIYSDVHCLEHDVLCPHVDLSMRLTDCWRLSCCYTMKHFYILINFAR